MYIKEISPPSPAQRGGRARGCQESRTPSPGAGCRQRAPAPRVLSGHGQARSYWGSRERQGSVWPDLGILVMGLHQAWTARCPVAWEHPSRQTTQHPHFSQHHLRPSHLFTSSYAPWSQTGRSFCISRQGTPHRTPIMTPTPTPDPHRHPGSPSKGEKNKHRQTWEHACHQLQAETRKAGRRTAQLSVSLPRTGSSPQQGQGERYHPCW